MDIKRRIEAMLHQGGIDPTGVKVLFTRELDNAHASDRRRYAQVDVDVMQFEFARAVRELDEAHLIGLLAHEVGHVLAAKHWDDLSEAGADRAALELLGVRVCYDRDWPGKGLQTMCAQAERNPHELTKLETIRRVRALLLDKSPESSTVIQDLLEEQNLSLVEASAWMARSDDSYFAPGLIADETVMGIFEVTRGPDPEKGDGHEGVAWYASRTASGVKWFIHVAAHVHVGDGMKVWVPVVRQGRYDYGARDQAIRDAVELAWRCVVTIKNDRYDPPIVVEQDLQIHFLEQINVPQQLLTVPDVAIGIPPDPDKPAFSSKDVAERNRDEHKRMQRKKLKENPAWVTSALADALSSLAEQQVPSQWLPRLDDIRSGAGGRLTAKIREFGCGAYGCVLPTFDQSVVLKVTTDDTEAEFASKLAADLVAPVCVVYYMASELEREHEHRRIFLLWREAADDVGDIDAVAGAAADEAVHLQHLAAQRVYRILRGAALEDDGEIESAVLAWRRACQSMAQVPALADLATGMLKVFDEQKIFFGDIHAGNLGRVFRGGPQGEWVITDPGHVAVL